MDLAHFAELGARTRVEQIQQELQEIFRQFPNIFPYGCPNLTGVQQRVKDRRTAAQKLIEGAERLHQQNQVKAKAKAKKKNKGWRRNQPNPNVTLADPTGEVMTLREAAEYVGMSTSGLRNYVIAGEIPELDRGAPRNGTRYRTSDIKDWYVQHTKQKPQAEQLPLQEDQREPAVVNG